MKNLLTIMVLYILLTISQAWSLPTCEGEESKWHNCEGSLTSASGKVYTGVFKDGIFEGKDKKKILKNAQNTDPNMIWKNGVCYVQDTALYPECHLYNPTSGSMHNSKRHDRNVSIMRIYNLGTMIIGQWQLR